MIFFTATLTLGVAACGLGEQTLSGTPVAAEVAAAASTAPDQVTAAPPTGPSTVTEYMTVPPAPDPIYSSADVDFLARLNARGIVTPSAATRAAGGHNVCDQLEGGSTLTAEANKLLDAPYRYWDALAGYFVGEAVTVYCPQYSYLLTR
ncbi:MAG: DUF732 domain-containing protein [Mycobacteriaceae bacterium]